MGNTEGGNTCCKRREKEEKEKCQEIVS